MNFIERIKIVRGNKSDYLELAEYHYIKTKVHLPTDVFFATMTGPQAKNFPKVLGVNVWATPIPNHKTRDFATNGFFLDLKNRRERLERLNRNMRYAARLIVRPEFRKRGLGYRLMAEPLLTTRIPLIETFTPIDFTNDMLVKAGFRQFYNPAPPHYQRFENVLKRFGLTKQSLHCPQIVHKRIASLGNGPARFCEYEIEVFLRHFRGWAKKPSSLEKTKFFLHKLKYPQVYFLWQNPRVRLTP